MSLSDAILKDLSTRLSGVVRKRKPTSSTAPNRRPNPTPATQPVSVAKGPPQPDQRNATLTEEQQKALKRWNSLTEEQQKDLSAQYTSAVNKRKTEREHAKYRPKGSRTYKSGPEWEKWSKEQSTTDSAATEATDTTPIPAEIAAAAAAAASSSSSSFLLSTRQGKLEAFTSCFLVAYFSASLLLPKDFNHTFTKQLCFGLLMGLCVLADQRGLLRTCCGGMEGMAVGMVLLWSVNMATPLIVLGCIGTCIIGGKLR